jgi:hypothetical protein
MSRLSATAYRAQFTPAPRIEPEVVVVSDADEEEPMEVEVKPPTLTNAPTSTPMVVPIPPVDALVPTATMCRRRPQLPVPPLVAREA